MKIFSEPAKDMLKKNSNSTIKTEVLWSKDMLKATGRKKPQINKCAKCFKIIAVRDEIKALNNTYHKSCLKCSICTKELNTEVLTDQESLFYCQVCFLKKRNKRNEHQKFEPKVKKSQRKEYPPIEE